MSRRARNDPGFDVKLDLIRWAESEGRGLQLRRKVILLKLAQLADDECCAWAKIDTLADAANCETRCAQTCVRELEALGLIVRTGRQHRLKNSSRSVPVYQLAPQVEGLGSSIKSMGAKPAPIEPHGCKTSAAMGAQGVHPYKEPKEPIEISTDISPERTRELAQIFDQLEVAYPAQGLGFSDQSVSRRAFLDLAAQGVAVEQLPAAAIAYGLDPVHKRRDYGIVSLQRWLSEGRYRAWLRRPAGGEPDAVTLGCDVPAEIVAELEAIAPVASFLAGAAWREADRTIVARLRFAADEITKRITKTKLAALNLRVVRPDSRGG